jgi:hypothetical protein
MMDESYYEGKVCEHCGVKLESGNTSVVSLAENLCIDCEHSKWGD